MKSVAKDWASAVHDVWRQMAPLGHKKLISGNMIQNATSAQELNPFIIPNVRTNLLGAKIPIPLPTAMWLQGWF